MRPPTLEQYCALIGATPNDFASWLSVTIEYVNLIAGIHDAVHKTENEFKYAELRKARGKAKILPKTQNRTILEPLPRFWADVVRICDHLAYDGSFKSASRRRGVAFIYDPRAIAIKMQDQFGWYWASVEKIRAAQKVKEGQTPNDQKDRRQETA